MYKSLLIAVSLLTVYSSGSSQPDKDPIDKRNSRWKIDSLQKEIKDVKEDKNLIKKLCLLSEYYRIFWPDSALRIAYQITELEKKLNYPGLRVMGYQCFSGIFYSHKKYDSCIYYMQKGLEICISRHFYDEENSYRRDLNNIYFLKDDYTNVMNISSAGLTNAEKADDNKWMAHYNNVLGCVAIKLKNFQLAERYFSAHLQLARQLKDQHGEEAHAYLNLSDLFVAQNKIPEAISSINRALNIFEAQRNRPFYNNSFGGYFSFAGEAYACNKLADVFKFMNKNDSAIKYSLHAVNIVKSALEKKEGGHNLYDVAAYYINAGEIYNRLNLPDSSLRYLKKGYYFADSIKHRELTRDAYEQLSVSYALKKKFDSAYFYHLAFSKLNDSILNENSERDILQREADLRIERQQRIQQAELARQQLWRNIIIVGAIFVIIIIVMLYNRRRIKQKILYQKELNKKQNELMSTVIAVQDKERKRIAEDLHDSIGSILSAAKLKLSAIAETAPVNRDGEKDNYEDTLNLLDEAVNEMRNISHNLLPASFLRLGLVPGLKDLIGKISSHSGMQIHFITYGFKGRIDETIEVSIYRIILEAVNNVVKHARAKNVTVQLMQYANYINILIEDDGMGFDRNKVSRKQGIGLSNIFSRVDYIKGRVDIDTKPKAGTVINIDIPYQQNNL